MTKAVGRGGTFVLISLIVGAVSIALLGVGRESADSAGDDPVAVVSGTPITRSDFAQYELVFVAPDGTSQVTREQVLLSLINQVLVQREGDARGISVSDSEIDGGVHAWEDLHASPESLTDTGGLAGLRSRLRMFILFDRVKEQVIGAPDVPPSEIAAAILVDPDLAMLPIAEAQAIVRSRLQQKLVASRWSEFLAGLRRCATIVVHDSSVNVPSSTPGPGCGPNR